MPAKSIASLDLYKLLGELSFLNGGFVRDVRSEKNEVFLSIFARGAEHWLKIAPGKYLSLAGKKPSETIAFPFTSKVKSELKGRRVGLSMRGADRIIDIATTDVKLVAELFSNGNLVLVREGRIEFALFSRDYGSRKVSAGLPFVYPKQPLNVFEIGYFDFRRALVESNKSSLVKALAVDLSLGGLYAEELAYRAEASKEVAPGSVNEDSCRRLYDSLKSMITEQPKPNIINGEAFSVIELKHLQGEKRYFGSISEALESFFAEEATQRQVRPKRDSIAVEKTLNEYQKLVDYLENNYEETSKMVGEFRDSSKNFEERKKALEEKGWRAEGKFIYRTDNLLIKIDMLKPLRDSIEEAYGRIKKLKRGLEMKVEPKETLRRLKFRETSAWYSKFRWFFTSNGNLVVLGRDNGQNLSLINKHLDKDDTVLHADVFGSPFCVLKPRKDSKVNETDIEEAAIAVASYSSAWKAGAGRLDVYWVKPEQVTKSPPSGESLKKGAFYIEGKREYIKGVALGLYLTVSIEGEEYALGVLPYKPEHGYILIRPGNKTRDEVLKRLIKAFSEKLRLSIERDKLDRLIPQGKSSVEKIRIE